MSPSRSPPTTRAGSWSTRSRAALEDGDPRPTVVALQAGNVHSGAFDPFTEAIALAHEHGAWVHVDGAFGLFAGASASYRHLVQGYEAADSWATDAHKTLNVPYDCGLAIVRDPADLRAAMSMVGPYLIQDAAGDPFEKVPELSRRNRAATVWAVLRSMGRSGVAGLVDRMAGHAATFGGRARRDAGGRRCSTTWCSPRSAPPSATTTARAPSSPGCSRTAPPGPPARPGTARACCGCRSATGRPPTTTSPARCEALRRAAATG